MCATLRRIGHAHRRESIFSVEMTSSSTSRPYANGKSCKLTSVKTMRSPLSSFGRRSRPLDVDARALLCGRVAGRTNVTFGVAVRLFRLNDFIKAD